MKTAHRLTFTSLHLKKKNLSLLGQGCRSLETLVKLQNKKHGAACGERMMDRRGWTMSVALHGEYDSCMTSGKVPVGGSS